MFLEVLHEGAADAVHHALGRPRRPARVHDEQRVRKRNLRRKYRIFSYNIAILFVVHSMLDLARREVEFDY